MIRKRRLSKVSSCLLLSALTDSQPSCCQAFILKLPLLGAYPARISQSASVSTRRLSVVRSNGEAPQEEPNISGASKDETTEKTSDKKESTGARQSVLYEDRTSEFNLAKKKKKEKEIKDRKITVYNNILQKNANDCSVCTVPDKIEPSKIAAPKKDQSNGVTPVQTLEMKLKGIKRQVNDIVLTPSVELADGLLILASSFLVAMTTVSILPPPVPIVLYFLQDATLFLFAFGFLSRWLSSQKPRGTYFNDPLEWVDLTVVVLPFLFLTVPGLADLFPPWLTSQAALINLRLLRILRFQRILQDDITFSKFVSGLRVPSFGSNNEDDLSCVIVEKWQLQLARVLINISTLLLVSTGLIYSAEHTVNPGINNYFDGLYFGLTTLTTVGLGDITPITWQGKLVVSGSILAGVAIIPAQAGALVEALLARNSEEELLTTTTANSAKAPVSPPASSMGKNLVLETAQTCPSCKSGLHWTQANFCYNCGAKVSF